MRRLIDEGVKVSPCPWCGENKECPPVLTKNGCYYRVECSHCGAKTVGGSSEEIAAEYWNDRPTERESGGVIIKLNEALSDIGHADENNIEEWLETIGNKVRKARDMLSKIENGASDGKA